MLNHEQQAVKGTDPSAGNNREHDMEEEFATEQNEKGRPTDAIVNYDSSFVSGASSSEGSVHTEDNSNDIDHYRRIFKEENDTEDESATEQNDERRPTDATEGSYDASSISDESSSESSVHTEESSNDVEHYQQLSKKKTKRIKLLKKKLEKAKRKSKKQQNRADTTLNKLKECEVQIEEMQNEIVSLRDIFVTVTQKFAVQARGKEEELAATRYEKEYLKGERVRLNQIRLQMMEELEKKSGHVQTLKNALIRLNINGGKFLPDEIQAIQASLYDVKRDFSIQREEEEKNEDGFSTPTSPKGLRKTTEIASKNDFSSLSHKDFVQAILNYENGVRGSFSFHNTRQIEFLTMQPSEIKEFTEQKLPLGSKTQDTILAETLKKQRRWW